MAITIHAHFDSAVVEADKDVFTKSYIEGKNAIIEFDMRKRDYQKMFGTSSAVYWSEKNYTVDVHEFSTFRSPIMYRFILAQGYYFDGNCNRIYFTPEISDVSAHHHMSCNIIRLSCFPAVICGVTLRNTAAIFSVLFRIPVTKSAVKRWIDEIGGNLPSEEEILKKLTDLKKADRCHIDACYPLGTDRCVTVIRDEHDRILITDETDTENADEAVKFLKKLKEAGIDITPAFSDYSESFLKAVKEVFPDAKFQADHFHSVKTIWEHLKKGLPEYRRNLKAAGEKEQDGEMSEIAPELWKLRWSLLKKPPNLSKEEKEAIEAVEKRDCGFISEFRSVIRQIVNISDHSDTEVQAEVKLKNLKNQIVEIENDHPGKICGFFGDHRNDAMRYLKKKGLGKYRRSSNSESGMRIPRRLEKNHDGIRSESTRKNYIKIYQVIKYLSADVTEFLNPRLENKV